MESQVDGQTVVSLLLNHELDIVRIATQNAILQTQNATLQLAIQDGAPNVTRLADPDQS
jgi:hypothetical protein